MTDDIEKLQFNSKDIINENINDSQIQHNDLNGDHINQKQIQQNQEIFFKQNKLSIRKENDIKNGEKHKIAYKQETAENMRFIDDYIEKLKLAKQTPENHILKKFIKSDIDPQKQKVKKQRMKKHDLQQLQSESDHASSQSNSERQYYIKTFSPQKSSARMQKKKKKKRGYEGNMLEEGESSYNNISDFTSPNGEEIKASKKSNQKEVNRYSNLQIMKNHNLNIKKTEQEFLLLKNAIFFENEIESPYKQLIPKNQNKFQQQDRIMSENQRIFSKLGDESTSIEMVSSLLSKQQQNNNLIKKDLQDHNQILELVSFDGLDGSQASSQQNNSEKGITFFHGNQQERKKFGPEFFNSREKSFSRAGYPTLTKKFRKKELALGYSTYNSPSSTYLANNHQTKKQIKLQEEQQTISMIINKELNQMEKHNKYRFNNEQFVLMFNRMPDEAIQFLIDQKIVKNNPFKIAYTLLLTEGLNKEALGKFFASEKDRNQRICQEFINLLDFKQQPYDEAIRQMLTRFKLPGESQQIDRIVTIFSLAYVKDNPGIFNDENEPFILGYTILMLQTNLHNEKISTKSKMKLKEFIAQNKAACPKINQQLLIDIYERVKKNKFTTKADYIETIYNRFQGSYINKISLQELPALLMKGNNFIKYSRQGKPKQKFVFISQTQDLICWRDLNSQNQKVRTIKIQDIIDLAIGSQTTKVLIKNQVPSEFDHCTFSLISNKRTLDLRADNPIIMGQWISYFMNILTNKKNMILNAKCFAQKRIEENQQIEEYWRCEFLPNWSKYWDYKNCMPLNIAKFKNDMKCELKLFLNEDQNAFKKIQSLQSAQSYIWNGCCDYFKTLVFNIKNYSRKKRREQTKMFFKDESENTGNNIINLLESKSKKINYQLILIWKKGLPNWVRQQLWPIVIQNQLEITRRLYNMLLQQVKGYWLMNVEQQDNELNLSLQKMEQDLTETYPIVFKEQVKRDRMIRILLAFIFYRPDIGYVKGMTHLSAMLINYLEEFEAFCALINLAHQNHFLSLFQGDMKEVQWRVQFFDKYFQLELPLLYNHFSVLDLSSEMFLFPWLLSLFSSISSIKIEIASRIWDNFLLEGELFAMKTALGILKYYQLELKMATYDKALNLLKHLPNDINESHLFYIIEDISISIGTYEQYFQNQYIAHINSLVGQMLLA